MATERFIVDDVSAGLRLDMFVARCYGAAADLMSRAGAQKLIDAGHVSINDGGAKASSRVKLHDRIEIRRPEVREIGLFAEALPLNILHEDQDILVIDKAAGMVVHPAAGRASGTLVNAVLHHCPDIAGIGGERRPGIVHRLDKDTSGVMVVAKNDLALRSLLEQFKSRTVQKEYLAIVHGAMAGGRGEIDRAIGRHRSDRKRMSSVRVTGKSRAATTQWVVEKNYAVPIGAREVARYSLVRLLPRTGRTHQIRVHLADLGFPLVGDGVYDRKRTVANHRDTLVAQVEKFPRHALHAEKLSFDHVRSGARLSFKAPLAEDMANLIAALNISMTSTESPRPRFSVLSGLTRLGV